MSDNSGSMFDDLFKDIDLTDPIKNASKQIGQQVDGIKDTTLNAVNTGSAAIKKGVATFNQLDSQITSTISAFQSETLGKLNDLLSALSGGLLNIDDFTDLISLTDGFKLNFDALLNKLSALIGFDITNIKGFISNFQNRLMARLNQLTGGYLSSQIDSAGRKLKITSNINSYQTQDALSIYGSLGMDDYSTSYNTAVKDAYNDSLLAYAVENGLVDSYGTIVSQASDSDAADKGLIFAMDTAIGKGDLASLDELNKLLTDKGKGALLDVYPNGAADLTKNFFIPDYISLGEYNEFGDLLWELCIVLNGPNWWKIYTQSWDWVPNLLIGSNFSDDVAKVWLEREEMIPLLGCSNKFRDRSAVDTFINDFPNVPVSFN